MEARWLVKFIGIELAGSAEIAAPVEKATWSPVEKVVAGFCGERGAKGKAY
jgi:hypothetical protein